MLALSLAGRARPAWRGRAAAAPLARRGAPQRAAGQSDPPGPGRLDDPGHQCAGRATDLGRGADPRPLPLADRTALQVVEESGSARDVAQSESLAHLV